MMRLRGRASSKEILNYSVYAIVEAVRAGRSFFMPAAAKNAEIPGRRCRLRHEAAEVRCTKEARAGESKSAQKEDQTVFPEKFWPDAASLLDMMHTHNHTQKSSLRKGGRQGQVQTQLPGFSYKTAAGFKSAAILSAFQVR